MKFLVLSPHYDDSVLSCSDHILHWHKDKIVVDIINIFTHYPLYLQYESIRKQEDETALSMLQVNSVRDLGLVDALFRKNKTTSCYTTTSLFIKKVNNGDRTTITTLVSKLSDINFKTYDRVYIPIAYGNHIDHILVKQIATKIISKNKLYFYVESPYFLTSYKRMFLEIIYLMIRREIQSVMIGSLFKKNVLKVYKSQVKSFKRVFRFNIEIIVKK